MSSDQVIRELAYRKWQEAGSPPNNDGVYFWLQAEAELARNGEPEVPFRMVKAAKTAVPRKTKL